MDNLFPDLTNIQTNRNNYIPNEFPQLDSESRIAVIGDIPHKDDFTHGQRPFLSPAGTFLRNLLHGAGISPMSCFFGYCCSYLPPKGAFTDFNYTSPEVQESLDRLQEDLARFQPNIVILLGDNAMRCFGFTSCPVEQWRGSLIQTTESQPRFSALKCMGIFDPFTILKRYDLMPLTRFDLKRAARESTTNFISRPVRTFDLNLSPDAILAKLDDIQTNHRAIALDIEGYCNAVTCVSIATSPSYAFIVPFNLFPVEDEAKIVMKLRQVFGDPSVPKILQNCTYDYFCLFWTFKIHLANIVIDTMLSGWELYPELPKGLGTQVSIYTDEPYYKYERKVDSDLTHWSYCCKDSAVTFEIAQYHMELLSPSAMEHFKFNMELLPCIQYMQLRGIKFDSVRAKELHDKTTAAMGEIQLRLDTVAGKSLNVNSPKQMCTFLYTDQRFPRQHPKAIGRPGVDKTKLTSNVDAILAIGKTVQSPVLGDILAWRKYEKIRQMLEVKTNDDGRVRCSYNIVGTETGRLNCYESASGSGTNLQTVTKKLRHLFVADEGHWFFNVDLSGADGWTVAAHCARFGDTMMLDDYLAKLKPAQIIALMYLRGADINLLSREDLRPLCKPIGQTEESEMIYFACKRVQHGTNYLLGKNTMADQILKDSYKLNGEPLYVSPKTCEDLQKLYLLRYKGVRAWQNKIQQTIVQSGRLPSASGHTRIFFGRRNDNATIREAVAHEPQHNTTFATNSALRRLWLDPQNRRPDGSLIIEPLHQVHDALNGQFPIGQETFFAERMHAYFAPPIEIAGRLISIPFEGGYGPNWGNICHPI